MKGIFIFLITLAVIGFLLIIFLTWSIFMGAPWSPSTKKDIQIMFALTKLQPGELMYDLGCGDGRVLIMAAKEYNARAIGIEIDPLRYIWCKLRIRMLGLKDQVQVKHGDFFSKDFSDADVIFCYLLQDTNNKLQEKFLAELQPKTRIVSKKFVFPDLALIASADKAEIYAYIVKASES
ncbi:MAG: SAM-dependent methyltransferase [Candidatus Heimdallarchaeota archaeon]